MVIDIIKSLNKLTYILLLFLLFNINNKLEAQMEDCELFEKKVLVIASDYPQFEEALNSFYSDSNVYDYIHIKIVGGNKQKSGLTRVFKSAEQWNYIIYEDKVVEEGVLKEGVNTLDLHLGNVKKGEFINICPYSSLNNTHIYMIKDKNTIKFKLISEPYTAHKIKTDIRIKGFISFIQEIDEVLSIIKSD